MPLPASSQPTRNTTPLRRSLLDRVDRRVIRSVVYALLTVILFLLFKTSEWMTEHYLTASKNQSMIAALAAALGLAIVFQIFHHRVESAIEGWLNYGAHERQKGLRALSQEIPLILDSETLQQRVVERLDYLLITQGTAIYLRRGDHDFLLAHTTIDSHPREISADDPAIIQLRLHHRPAVPIAVDSRLAMPMLWPMQVHGHLIGFIASGERRHRESFDDSEVNAVAELAESVATALALIDPSVAEMPAAAAAAAPIDDDTPSIAVLPFVNMSKDAGNEYFADGLAEELVNVLSKIRGLRVASRTSAFSFKGKDVDIPTIAKKLHVATILEGSVRAAGQRVRITAQIVQVATDSHLWSQTYDRELEDIFAVQDDIAQAVVKELRAALLGEKPDASASAAVKAVVQAAAKGRGENAKAYPLYLQGQFFADRITQEDVAKGIEYFRQAVELDPGYALAWAGLSRAYLSEAGYLWAPLDEGFGRARTAAERALELEPDLAEGYVALGLVQMYYDWDWQRADASFRRALELAPGKAEVLRGAAILAGTIGRHEEAVALARRAVMLDPLSMIAHGSLGSRCLSAGLLDEAEEAIKKAIELHPQGGLLYCWLGRVHLEQGRIEEAQRAFEGEVIEDFHLQGLALVEHAQGRRAESDAALRGLIDKYAQVSAYQVAEVYAYRGEADLAFQWLARAYAQHDPGLSASKSNALLRDLHGDPRWQTLLEKIGLAD